MIRTFGIFLVFGIHLIYAQRRDFPNSNFGKADRIAKQLHGASLKNLPVLVHKLTNKLDKDEEKFRAMYTWICTNIRNDYYAYLRTTKKRKKLANDSLALANWNNSFIPKVIEKLIRDKETACTGYAFLMKEMSSLAGIPCEIVSGYGRTPNMDLDLQSPPNHSWNAVKLQEKWYLCDPTWSAGVTNFATGKPVFQQEYYDGYFLSDPRIFVKNHYPLDAKWALLKELPSFQEFLEGPVVYKDAAALDILPVFPTEMNLNTIKKKAVEFVVECPNVDSSLPIDLLLGQGNSLTPVLPTQRKDGPVYVLSYPFPKKGSYDIHLRWDKKVFATYTIRVSRK